jgi:hypothetical protein
VLSGTWWVGSGPKFDPDHGTVPMPAGSFVTHFGKQAHAEPLLGRGLVLLGGGDGAINRGIKRRRRGVRLIERARAYSAWGARFAASAAAIFAPSC